MAQPKSPSLLIIWKLAAFAVLLLIGHAAALAAAAPAFAATTSSVTVDGRGYETVIREFNQGGRTVKTGEVRVGFYSYGCNPLQSGSCENVVRRALDASSPRLTEGVPASTIRQIIR